MKIDRPLWGAGALLSPQQFQQQARWEAWTNECLAHLSRVHPWGVQVASFDLDALRLGKLKATRLRVRLPDGTLIDTDTTDRLPPALELSRQAEEEVSVVTLLLALPLEHANGGNCLMGEGKSSRPSRYRQDWREVQDLYGEESQSMAALEHVLSLRLDSDENAEYLTCPVVRVVRDGQGAWTLDPQFVPPLLSFDAQPQLLAQLDNLMTQLAAKRSRLMGMRRESNQRMADFAVADVSLFWLLNALNSYQPVLADLLAHPGRHPEQVYQELVKLAGSLLTFSLEHDIGAIPDYRHNQLEAVFPPLFRLISTLLEASLPSRVIALTLEQPNAYRWQVALHDGRLRDAEGVDFYLSVRSSLPAAQVQSQFPRLCKVGAPDDVDHLVNVALDGVPLLPLSHVPAAIPMRLGNQYFALDLAHPKAQAMLSAGVCALYVPGTLGEVQLDLFAVLRS
ncbi:type VI secretion system baseplate subunit TssK [Pseudomonas sp. NBRC 100443]|uniref:type VI secretion system baseplate subunit TssK n=1 Tax=Pseudomonas sp. NBRC 100443 TaxID=1113665 RepID=UPI0024A4ACB3|nr:type VI secretion system baseplate subunit TssK [Pseudomonas sp. NBRC 100443]GLU41171.1 type VI secretion protein [Pseudomonas sp. NBRC 100443]